VRCSGFKGHSHISHFHVPRWAQAGKAMAQSRAVTRPADLPDYNNPPVNEVVIGIQFNPTAITGAHIGLFWEGLRDEFPKASEQPPLESRIESFQPHRFSAPVLELSSWRGSRHWLTSEDDVQLIQIQADRLFYNWRRGQNNATYPHFESLQERFWSVAEKWSAFLKEIEKPLRLTQWEVSYINHILTPGGQPTLADVLSFWGGELDLAMGGPAEAGRMEAQKILTENNSPWARMYINITTAIRGDQIPLIAFELTVRGPPGDEDAWNVTHDRLLKGRHQIVTAFDALTTEKMHAIWGKRK
jgi:uncharacterized protein (TIGR04255 family)